MKLDVAVEDNKRKENKKERKIKIMEKVVGEGVKFERIRRVTGYLSGDVSRFNNGKRAEEKDRVKHSGVKEVISEEKCKA